jgi:hypothetical protein
MATCPVCHQDVEDVNMHMMEQVDNGDQPHMDAAESEEVMNEDAS